jgi:hypothetical protein
VGSFCLPRAAVARRASLPLVGWTRETVTGDEKREGDTFIDGSSKSRIGTHDVAVTGVPI